MSTTNAKETSKPNAPKAIVPLDSHLDYSPAASMLRKLESEQAKLESWLSSANNELAQHGAKRTAALAKELLANGDLNLPDVHAIEHKAEGLRNRLIVIRAAIDQQKEVCRKAMQAASRKVAAEFQPVHAAAVREFLAAAVALAEATQREQDTRIQLADLGYETSGYFRAFTVTDHGVPGIGRLVDYGSQVNAMLREAVEFNYLSLDDPLLKVGKTLNGGESFYPHVKERQAREEAERRRYEAYRYGRMDPGEAKKYGAALEAAEKKRIEDAEARDVEHRRQLARREREARESNKQRSLAGRMAAAVGL